jgi:hypothetical protein
MANDTQICNLALSYLGQGQITNLLTPTTATEQLCALNFAPVRDAVLESQDWAFAMARATLNTPSIPAPDWGMAHAFNLPNDALRVIWAGNNQNENQYNAGFDWRIENGQLVCGANPVWIRYIRRVEDASKFSPLFVQAFAMRLAVEMCIATTESTTLYNQLTAMYAIKLEEAAANNGMQGRAQTIKQRILSSAR